MTEAITRAAIEQLLYLLDQAFEESDQQEHGLLTNLASVPEEYWQWLPPGGARTIAQIAEHVGECKFMYTNYAFEDGQKSWHEFDARNASLPPKGEMIEWLQEGQALFRGYTAALANDYELMALRKAPWGREYWTRWLIASMIEHDLYHAGEINDIRALAQGNDAWPDYS